MRVLRDHNVGVNGELFEDEKLSFCRGGPQRFAKERFSCNYNEGETASELQLELSKDVLQ